MIRCPRNWGRFTHLEKGSVAITLTSARARQVSYEDPALGHGVFTHYLLEALHGQADLVGDKNGLVTVQEVERYLGQTVPSYTKEHFKGLQLPWCSPESEPDYVLAVTRKALDREELRMAGALEDLERASRSFDGKDWPTALRSIRSVLKRVPKNRAAIQLLAEILIAPSENVSELDLREAIGAFESLTEDQPGDIRLLAGLAKSWCRMGNIERGSEIASTVQTIDPVDPEAARVYAVCLQAAKNGGQAPSAQDVVRRRALQAVERVESVQAAAPSIGNREPECGVAVCAEICAEIPIGADVEEVRVFSRWQGDKSPWEIRECQLEQLCDSGRFEKPRQFSSGSSVKKYCSNFKNWADKRDREVRVVVAYTEAANTPPSGVGGLIRSDTK